MNGNRTRARIVARRPRLSSDARRHGVPPVEPAPKPNCASIAAQEKVANRATFEYETSCGRITNRREQSIRLLLSLFSMYLFETSSPKLVVCLRPAGRSVSSSSARVGPLTKNVLPMTTPDALLSAIAFLPSRRKALFSEYLDCSAPPEQDRRSTACCRVSRRTPLQQPVLPPKRHPPEKAATRPRKGSWMHGGIRQEGRRINDASFRGTKTGVRLTSIPARIGAIPRSARPPPYGGPFRQSIFFRADIKKTPFP